MTTIELKTETPRLVLDYRCACCNQRIPLPPWLTFGQVLDLLTEHGCEPAALKSELNSSGSKG